MNTFGETLRDLVKHRGISVRQLCLRIDYDTGNMTKILKGQLYPPQLELIQRIADALDLTSRQRRSLIEASRDWHLEKVKRDFEF